MIEGSKKNPRATLTVFLWPKLNFIGGDKCPTTPILSLCTTRAPVGANKSHEKKETLHTAAKIGRRIAHPYTAERRDVLGRWGLHNGYMDNPRLGIYLEVGNRLLQSDEYWQTVQINISLSCPFCPQTAHSAIFLSRNCWWSTYEYMHICIYICRKHHNIAHNTRLSTSDALCTHRTKLPVWKLSLIHISEPTRPY